MTGNNNLPYRHTALNESSGQKRTDGHILRMAGILVIIRFPETGISDQARTICIHGTG